MGKMIKIKVEMEMGRVVMRTQRTWSLMTTTMMMMMTTVSHRRRILWRTVSSSRGRRTNLRRRWKN